MLQSGTKSANRRILIVGATGELGGALALSCACDHASLSLWGRDLVKLDSIAAQCVVAGASAVATRSVDLCDLDAALRALAIDDDESPFDIALFAAGLGDIREPGTPFEDARLVARLVSVNFLGPGALAASLANRMARRNRGRIGFVGSAAGFHSMPFAAAYSSSKGGLARFADALRIAMQPHGVTVTLVSPGFIDTAAAHRVSGPKPFMQSSERAAKVVLAATLAGKGHVIAPWPFAVLRVIMAVMPQFLRDRLLRSLAPPGR